MPGAARKKRVKPSRRDVRSEEKWNETLALFASPLTSLSHALHLPPPRAHLSTHSAAPGICSHFRNGALSPSLPLSTYVGHLSCVAASNSITKRAHPTQRSSLPSRWKESSLFQFRARLCFFSLPMLSPLQGDTSDQLKPPVDLFPTFPAACGALL